MIFIAMCSRLNVDEKVRKAKLLVYKRTQTLEMKRKVKKKARKSRYIVPPMEDGLVLLGPPLVVPASLFQPDPRLTRESGKHFGSVGRGLVNDSLKCTRNPKPRHTNRCAGS